MKLQWLSWSSIAALAFIGAGLLFGAMAGLMIARPSPSSAQFLTPGPLSRDHRELEGDQHCNDCHSSGRRLSKDRCLECHDDLRARIRAGKGLHGREYRNRDCGRCHVEHLGRNAKQVRWPKGRMEAFDHGLAGWDLRGAPYPDQMPRVP